MPHDWRIAFAGVAAAMPERAGNPLVKITGDIRELDFLGGYTDELRKQLRAAC
jgi:hypothetical protein